MKKLLSLIVALSTVLVSCEGDPGPPGPPGADGLIGTVLEYTLTFSDANDFAQLVDFPNNVEVFESDVVMAYRLVEVDNGLDIWEPLPQTLFFQDGILLYGFNHSFVDIEFFLDGTVNLFTLDTDLTVSQTFRVAIIPAAYAKNLDLGNMAQVMAVSKMINTDASLKL